MTGICERVDEPPKKHKGRSFPRERTMFLRTVKAQPGHWCMYRPTNDPATPESQLAHFKKLADEDFTVMCRKGNIYARYMPH